MMKRLFWTVWNQFTRYLSYFWSKNNKPKFYNLIMSDRGSFQWKRYFTESLVKLSTCHLICCPVSLMSASSSAINPCLSPNQQLLKGFWRTTCENWYVKFVLTLFFLVTAIYGKFSSPVYLTNTAFRNFDYFLRAFHPSIYPPPTHSSIHPFFVRPSVHPFICSFVLSFFSLSFRTSYCSFFPLVHLFVQLCIYLFIFLFLFSSLHVWTENSQHGDNTRCEFCWTKCSVYCGVSVSIQEPAYVI